MDNKIMVGIVIIGVILLAGFILMRMDTPTVPEEEDLAAEEQRVIAEEWVKNRAPTFTERGGEEMEHISTTEIEEDLFEVVFSFNSRFSGYGELDEDEVVAQVITPHTIVITVEEGEVIGAVTDEVFDEYEGAMFEEEVREEDDYEMTTVNVYFATVEDGQETVVAIEREVLAENKEASALLELLEKPETGDYFTVITEGTTLNSFSIENGVAYADFSAELDASGSATVIMIREQIEKTLLQFDSIDEVEISIEGETEEILQP